jgi:hypothetical protein
MTDAEEICIVILFFAVIAGAVTLIFLKMFKGW